MKKEGGQGRLNRRGGREKRGGNGNIGMGFPDSKPVQIPQAIPCSQGSGLLFFFANDLDYKIGISWSIFPIPRIRSRRNGPKRLGNRLTDTLYPPPIPFLRKNRVIRG
jgi:hypothetical protein